MLGARRVTIRKLHTKDQQILGATVQTLVATMNCHQRFVHPWNNTPFTKPGRQVVWITPENSFIERNREKVLAFSRSNATKYHIVLFNVKIMKSLTFWWPSIVIYSYDRSQQDVLFLNFILIYTSICFGQTCSPSSGVLILCSQQMVFMLTVC